MTSADDFAAVRREARELGIPVSAKAILIAEERVTVRVISFVARMVGSGSAEPSIEHTELGWHALDTVDNLVMPDGYKHSIAAAAKTSR